MRTAGQATEAGSASPTPLRITCVIGPYFPVPPKLGGAVERIFHALTTEFARRGHAVTVVSRRFAGLPDEEVVDGVRHLRLPSRDAPRNRFLYRLFDIVYALRACLALPRSDVTITHSVFLPLIIPKRRAGKIYVSVARFPKGQMGLYRRADRLQAVSSHVAKAICEQNPSVASRVKVIPNALSNAFYRAASEPESPRRTEILFVGRIAREKGIDILIRAFLRVAERNPDWRLVIVGPHEAAHGGDGDAFLHELKRECGAFLDRIDFAGPIFGVEQLIARFRQAEIFVYPSVAAQGESFGMAPLEAMACGCATVTSALDCFRDFVQDGVNGLQFDHTDRTGNALAAALNRLIVSPELRAEMSRQGVGTSRMFTAAKIADRFLADFSQLSCTRAVPDPSTARR